MFHIHKWSDWSEPQLYWYIMYIQYRTCSVCGKEQSKIITINIPPGSYGK